MHDYIDVFRKIESNKALTSDDVRILEERSEGNILTNEFEGNVNEYILFKGEGEVRISVKNTGRGFEVTTASKSIQLYLVNAEAGQPDEDVTAKRRDQIEVNKAAAAKSAGVVR